MVSKEKIKKHANGSSYWNFSVMERKEPDQYGNTHYVVEGQGKEERAAKAPKNYLKSSGKEFIFGGDGNGGQAVAANENVDNDTDEHDDLPF